MYADDLQLYLPSSPEGLGERVNLINDDLKLLVSWAQDNSLLVNPNKTQAVLFSRMDIPTFNLQLTINDILIEWKDEVKNLGLYMDKALTFNGHVNKICQRAFFRLTLIYEFKNYLPVHTKKVLVDSLVLSIPAYLDYVYRPYLTSFNGYRIQKIQNSCVRYVRGLRYRDHVSQHIVELFQFKMAQRSFIHLACLIHNVIVTITPIYLFEMIAFRGNLHQVNIRNKTSIDIPKHRTEFYKSSFPYLAAYVYNLIPDNIRQKKIGSFKLDVKQFVLQNQLSF